MELDQSLAEAHAALAETELAYEWDCEGAEEAFRRAVELDPNIAVAHRYYAWYLVLMGPRAATRTARPCRRDTEGKFEV